MPDPVRVAGQAVLEAESPAVWFTFPDAHHDIGRFHTPDGRFTGCYANILTPVRILPPDEEGHDRWRTTDLFLDVFLTPGGEIHVLDVEELETALAEGWIGEADAVRARAEAARLVRGARAGRWPPPVVRAWTLERARAVAEGEGTPPVEAV